MKAITVKEAGPAESLKIVDLPDPQPSKDQVVIRQTFAGVNYGDAIRRKRGLFKLNESGYFIPGFEGVGNIVSIGGEVKSFKVGDRVAYLNEMGGGYGQQICVNEQFVFPVPNYITDKTVAGMTCVGSTAWHLTKLSEMKRDSWVLIHGATGGVGLALVQLAILNGAKVIAVVGTKEKKEVLKKYKITETIIRGTLDISSQIMSSTNGHGIDIIFDCVGQAVLETNLNCIRKGGIILYYGSTSGHPSFPGLQILMNSVRIQGFNIFNLLQDTEKWQNGLKELFSLIEEQKLEVNINKVFPMSKAHEAHRLLEDRHSTGKLLIDLR